MQLCEQWLAGHALRHVVTLNAEMVVLAQHNVRFRKAVANATLRTPDGAGVIWAKQYLESDSQSLLASLATFFFHRSPRVSGADMVTELASLAAQREQVLYLLGGKQSETVRAAEILTTMFPTLRVHTSAEHAYDINGPEYIITDIRKVAPTILLVAYGAPKQTEWIEAHKHDLPSVRIAVGIGGALAMVSNTKPRAPRLLRRHNIEWLWRLLLEPRRARRIYRAVVEFPTLIQSQKGTEQ